ncbi:hypothetical protein ACQKRQ_02380 [Paraburkholderia sp. NPDC080076]|uniref:hypothetical protein n=1 Tax=Paraburkholderia sp. NPDC080076 TaxID=3390605 RepID=UPI003CFBCED9
MLEEYQRTFPAGAEDVDGIPGNMWTFYYSRISNTANLLVRILAVFITFIALIVSVIVLLHSYTTMRLR